MKPQSESIELHDWRKMADLLSAVSVLEPLLAEGKALRQLLQHLGEPEWQYYMRALNQQSVAVQCESTITTDKGVRLIFLHGTLIVRRMKKSYFLCIEFSSSEEIFRAILEKARTFAACDFVSRQTLASS